jgi:hypothetical protein
MPWGGAVRLGFPLGEHVSSFRSQAARSARGQKIDFNTFPAGSEISRCRSCLLVLPVFCAQHMGADRTIRIFDIFMRFFY